MSTVWNITVSSGSFECKHIFRRCSIDKEAEDVKSSTLEWFTKYSMADIYLGWWDAAAMMYLQVTWAADGKDSNDTSHIRYRAKKWNSKPTGLL